MALFLCQRVVGVVNHEGHSALTLFFNDLYDKS